MAWEVDWTHPGNTGEKLWARNPTSGRRSAREWHFVGAGHLRAQGIETPGYSTEGWEVDWAVRDGKRVWARNTRSKMPSAREWHWVDFHTLERAGVAWKAKKPRTGGWVNAQGYVCLSRTALSTADIELAERHGLFRGERNMWVREHQLVAIKKYGSIPSGWVVRHINGVKHDNSPGNIVIGTTQQNTADPNTARVGWMVESERANRLEEETSRLRAILEEHGIPF